MWDAILDAFLDTLKIFPFIFVIYVLIELLEHKTSFSQDHERLQGDFAPLIGAATGIIPQCGFSVMAAKLYDKGLIRTGTLLAVFLATSDEALIILLSDGSRAYVIVPLVVIKMIVAVAVGYGANFGGLSALLSMLNSCASGVSVVNIDNGFGASYLASRINKMEAAIE